MLCGAWSRGGGLSHRAGSGSGSTKSFDSSGDESPNADSVALTGPLRLHELPWEGCGPFVSAGDKRLDADSATLTESFLLHDSLCRAASPGFGMGCCNGAFCLDGVGVAGLLTGGAENTPDQLKTVGNWVTSKLN